MTATKTPLSAPPAPAAAANTSISELREHPYAEFLHRVQKPSRYIGGEHGELRKDWSTVDCSMCLAFPDLYDVGMSHLGFKILYSLLNAHPKLAAERCYAPWVDMEAELRARNEPLRSLETWRALRDFDVVGFSLQFELTFSNILQMLDLGGIPLRSADRSDTDPLIIAGGPTATHAEAIAPFIDAFVVGDGEQKTPELLLTWAALKRAGMPRHERLAQLAKLGGIYVPALYATELEPSTGFHYVSRALHPDAPLPIKRAFVENLGDYPFPTTGPVASTETVFDRISIEIARGCTEGCRFCQAGMIYRPVRERTPDEIIGALQTAIQEGGYDEASLTSLSTADYSAIAPLVHRITHELKEKKVSVSVSSLRAYGLSEHVLDDLQTGKAAGLTFAPEAGTQRMRDVINKNVTDEQLMETARRVFSRGWEKMKLYFIIGLPTETDEDVMGIVQTGTRAQNIGKGLTGSRARVTVSVSSHVPKPHTPFQWCAMDTREEILRKQALLKEEARRDKVNLRMHDSMGSWLEGILARGDRRVGDAIEGAYLKGARFDSWDDRFKLDAWREAFAEAGIETEPFFQTLPLHARLPWDHIDVGLDDGFLEREYKKALKNRLSPPCGKVAGMFVHHTNLQEAEQDAKRLVCYDCGIACDMSQMRSQRQDALIQLGATTPRPAAPTPAPRTKKNRKPQVQYVQGRPMRVRLRFTKLGRAAFSSHLDLVRLLPRLFRRLELPLFYSQGFHPKPQLAFGPALSLGVAGLSEYVDVKLCDGVMVDEDTLPAQLSDASIDGVRFLDARRLEFGDAALGQIIDTAMYAAGIPMRELQARGIADVQALQAHVAARRTGELKVRRSVDGIGKQIDVGRVLREVRVGEGLESLRQAGLMGDLVPISLTLAMTAQGSAKASEAIEALTGWPELANRIVRTALVGHVDASASTVDADASHVEGRAVTPMDLDALRSHAQARRQAKEALAAAESAAAEAAAL